METSTVDNMALMGAAGPACRAPSVSPAGERQQDAADRLTALADRLKALADPTRLGILGLLARHDAPLCVCEITERFDLRQPTISHHLRLLREADLITGEKRGVWSYYAATSTGRAALGLLSALG